jgi:hypothetical protein
MDRYAELILKLLEIQVDSKPRSPELIAEDDKLMEGLERRYQEGLSYRCSDFRRNPDQFSPTPSIEIYAKAAARLPQTVLTWDVLDVERQGTSPQVDKAA